MNILIVEDRPEHMEAAKAACIAEGIQFVTADGSERAQWLLDHATKMELDGVITDIFMPEEHGRLEVPAGVGVAVRAEALGLPFVFCTSGYHHGDQYSWIHELGRKLRWPPMIDKSVDDGGPKDWHRAISDLLKLVETKNGAV